MFIKDDNFITSYTIIYLLKTENITYKLTVDESVHNLKYLYPAFMLLESNTGCVIL